MGKIYLDPQEITLLEQEALNLRDRLLIRILFRLGCRISEALAITIDDIDFKQGTISIIHLKHRVKLFCEKCGASLSLSHIYCPKCGSKTNADS